MQFQREWTPKPGQIPCLSIQQPYSSAIIWGKKTIELRTWATSYRGVIAIHAGLECVGGLRLDKPADEEQIRAMIEAITRLGCPSQKMRDYPLGSIIGVARLVRCAPFRSKESYAEMYDQHKSNAPWTRFTRGWQFADVQALETPIPTRGYLGLFSVPRAPLEGLRTEQLKTR